MNILEKKGRAFDAMSLSEIKSKHNMALELEPSQFKTSLNNIQLISDKEIAIRTHSNKHLELAISSNVYEEFLALNLFNKKVSNTFSEILNDKTKAINLVNTFKTELVKNKGDIPITIFGDRQSSKVVKMLKGNKSSNIINNDSFLKILYKLAGKYNLSLFDFKVDSIGQISINSFVNDDNPFVINDLNKNSKFGIAENETFYRGLHFMSNIGNYGITPSTLRIFCTNQLVLSKLEDSIHFKDLSIKNVNYINKKMEALKEQNFLPTSFISQVKNAYSIPASLNELEKVVNSILKYSKMKEEDLEPYLGYGEIKNNFEVYESSKALKLNNLMKMQLPIDKTVWQLANVMTYIASNESNLQIADSQRSYLMMDAGRFLSGDSNGVFDLQLKLDSPYINMWN